MLKRIAVLLSAGLIFAFCFFHLAHSIANHDKYFQDAFRIGLYYVLPLAGVVLAIVLAFRTSDLSAVLAVNIAAILFAVLLFEALVVSAGSTGGNYGPTREDYAAAKKSHARTSVAMPILSYANLLEKDATGGARQPFPLGGLSQSYTLLCAEGRPVIAYASDRYGFNNPDGLWAAGAAASPSVALIGDSFIHGVCNPDGAMIPDVVRRTFPATYSLGYSGNGPLIELATLIEYGRPASPKHIVWCFFEGNDFDDLDIEKNLALLRRYLEPEWTAHLASRQGEIDAIVQAKLDRDVIDKLGTTAAPRSAFATIQALGAAKWVRRVIGLQTLGGQLGLFWGRGGGDSVLLEQVLRRAKAEAQSWGATLHFCYLPSSLRFRGWLKIRPPHDAFRAKVLAVARRLGLPTVDVTDAFERSGEGLGLFLSSQMHYSDRGARIAGEAIAAHLATSAR
jgi:hypothetical protein